MSSSSRVRDAILASCTPVRCSTTPLFDLGTLLRASTAREDDAEAAGELDPATEPAEPPHSLAQEAAALQLNPDDFEPRQTPLAKRPHPEPPSPTQDAAQPRDYQHRVRKRRRHAQIQAEGHIPRPKTVRAIIPPALGAAKTHPMDYIDLPATNGAYGARVSRASAADRVYTLEEIEDLGIRVFPWDGTNPVPFLDSEGRVFLVLAGRPADKPGARKAFTQSCQDAYLLLEREASTACFSAENLHHRRGDYPVINVGVTHGMGTVRPTALDVRPNETTVQHLLASPDFQRIANFGSACFALWFPDTHGYYKNHLDPMFERTGLPRIFPGSVFPAAAFNCGPNACTKKHTDGKNCPFGQCSVTSLGRFNPKKGGHLILWELGLAVEFPPGSTILLPSAVISHSNTSVLDDEVRASFTQYSSGGLFRWVDYGFQTEKVLKKTDPQLYHKLMELRPDRWKLGVDLFSTIEDLKALGSVVG